MYVYKVHNYTDCEKILTYDLLLSPVYSYKVK